MKPKAFFIMILILLAALFGVAQEDYVVYEGAESTHNVELHSGNEYLWEVYKNLNPDIPAEPTEFYFVGPNNANTVTVHWVTAGFYYLKVSETDPDGCSNVKALTVSVVTNNRSIGFSSLSSSECYSTTDNGFQLAVQALDNKGDLLNASYYPLQVSFLVNQSTYSQSVTYTNQFIEITDDMFASTPDDDTEIIVEITEAIDNQNGGISPSNAAVHERIIFAQPTVQFTNSTSGIVQGTTFTHNVAISSGNSNNAVYNWSVQPANGTSTELSLINGNNAEILWDGSLGEYTLIVSVVDGNGCVGDTISQQITIVDSDKLLISAGSDTTIGSCNPYQLQAWVSDTTGLSYLWDPVENLDDPTVLNPVFTPGITTTFILTVTDPSGLMIVDTVTIEVSEILADAGADVFMEEGSTAMLDGSASMGAGIIYQWTTISGKIEIGENTANPIVSDFGTYYLNITDRYGCRSSDSVSVIKLIQAPIANDDYDTTTYLTEVIIPVLDNDYDPQNSLDSTSLKIILAPFNGIAYVDYEDYTIHYRPDRNFSGNDNFEYQICNTYDLCDEANVHVLVTDYKFQIPEAFSPNGDNINDYFEIVGIEYYQGNNIKIFNRWGTVVYEAYNYGISSNPRYWDGKANTGNRNGDDGLTTGTYFYILDLGNGEQAISGSIYLDR